MSVYLSVGLPSTLFRCFALPLPPSPTPSPSHFRVWFPLFDLDENVDDRWKGGVDESDEKRGQKVDEEEVEVVGVVVVVVVVDVVVAAVIAAVVERSGLR